MSVFIRLGLPVALLLAGGCAARPAAVPAATWVAPPPVSPSVSASASASASVSASASAEVMLAFAGDVHFSGRTLPLLDQPTTAFGSVGSVLAAADLAMVNLETAVTDRGTPEPKEFHFRAPASAYEAVRAAGVDVVSLANNHALDYGPVGLVDTLASAQAAGVPAVGAGTDASAAYAPWVANVRGTRIAFLGFSQVGELWTSWRATDTRPGIAMARDLARALAAVRAARAVSDLVVVYVHWGQEGNACPTGEMRSFAGQLAGAGADIVVGTHAHLLLGDGWLGRTYVQYGLGNFLWWRDDAFSNDTGVLRIIVRDRTIVRTELIAAGISRRTGQPIPVTGAEATRITRAYTGLRGCTGLSDEPTARDGTGP